MRIVFLLPMRSTAPTGGYKVVYEYSNRLVRAGHEVVVVHPWSCPGPPAPFRQRVHARRWTLASRLRPAGLVPWFSVEPGVELRAVDHPALARIPRGDVIVATAWHTAAPVLAAAAAQGVGGAYLIQGYETWDGAVESVRETWRLPLRKVVISHWLEEIAAELGVAGSTTRVPLGMDLDRLGVDRPPAARRPRLGSLFHPGAAKGSADVIAAMEQVRRELPTVSAFFFGSRRRPAELPGWIEYEQLPSPARLRELYNSCSVFLGASRSEGWGLPASEAMLCGAALVTVDNGGSREFAVDGETALVVPPQQAGEIGARATALLGDEPLRLRLAEAGAERLRGFTWERALGGFEAVLEQAAATGGGGR